MYDLMKPDLVVQNKFLDNVKSFDTLLQQYNVISSDELTIELSVQPVLITKNNALSLKNVKLLPYFTRTQLKRGILPASTSYRFEEPTPIYRIIERGPRYVIWDSNDLLTVCASYLDVVSSNGSDLYAACERAKRWAKPIKEFKSIIVFDLDETLIDRNGEIHAYCTDILMQAKRNYDYVVLYSHGSDLHVDEHVLKIEKHTKLHNCFNLVLSNNGIMPKANKNLLYLYNYFPNVRFTNATLVDDSLFNWTPEYTNFVIPASSSLKYASSFI